VLIFAARQLAAALRLMRRPGRGRRRHTPLTSPSPNAVRSISAHRPARDREGRLAGCLAPLAGDPDLAEIIVVDDESPDRSAAIREEQGAAVLAGRALPPGPAVRWWALDQGLRAARGDLAVYLDADNLPRSAVPRPVPSTAPAAHRENP
jgi:dolichol-phosphate mannosyltransferase